jgi:hypothetical protein
VSRSSTTGAAAAAVAICLAATACGGGTPAAAPSPTGALPTTSGAVAPGTTAAAVPPGSAAPVSGSYAPRIDPAAFTSTVDNAYFPLPRGARWEYREVSKDGVETTVVEVTSRTRTIMGVPCVEVRDTVRLDGEVIEDTLDWYAQHGDGTVWYFGEDTKEYENGKVTSTEGTWEAGVDGAFPGIVMPALPRVGDRYRQEYYRGQAEDLAEVLAVAERAVQVPTGSYADVVMTSDTTPLEPDLREQKYYARGVGPVLTVNVGGGGSRDELVRFTR